MRKRHMLAGAAAFVAAALVAALGVAPAPALADPYTAVSADDLQAAIAGGETEITLGEDITASITVPAGQTLTLNLGGHKLTGAQKWAAITNNGNLTVTGEGAVDGSNVSQTAALYNAPGATANLNGGTFMGSKWYVIKNLGTMTIDGASVTQFDAGTSAIDNGWYGSTGNDCGLSEPADAHVSLTINSGSVSNGMNAVKNDDFGFLTINGGSFTSTSGPALLNWNVAEVNDGTFSVSETASSLIANGAYGNTADQGKLTIKGGNFTSANDGAGSLFGTGNVNNTGTVDIQAGTFNGSLANLGADDGINLAPAVSSGQFSDSSVAKFVTSGNVTSYKQGKFYVNAADEVENLAVATVEVNGQTIYFYNTDDANTFAKENGKTADDVDRLVYFVDFETNGHGEFQTAMVKAGEAVGDQIPAVPEVEGYTVSGWYDGDTKVDATFVPTSDVTLVAMWTKNPAKSDPKTDPKADTKPADGDKKADAPKKALPQTGDNTNMMVPVAIAVAGIVVVVAAVALRRRNN